MTANGKVLQVLQPRIRRNCVTRKDAATKANLVECQRRNKILLDKPNNRFRRFFFAESYSAKNSLGELRKLEGRDID